MKYNHLAISVSNLEKSIDFYKDILGFSEIKRAERDDLKIKIALLKINQNDDLKLELLEHEEFKKNKDDFSDLSVLGLKHLCFEVDNAEEKRIELESKGYEVTNIKKGKTLSKYFFLKDPDGFTVEICEL